MLRGAGGRAGCAEPELIWANAGAPTRMETSMNFRIIEEPCPASRKPVRGAVLALLAAL